MSKILRTQNVHTLLFAVVMFGIFICALPSHAQSLDCIFTYTSAPADPSMTFCVSPNGNLTQLQIPIGPLNMVNEDYIGSSGLVEGYEGYGVCQESPVASYYDYLNNFGEGGTWGTATVVSQTVTSIKIERTTLDGDWTLTQTFTAEVKTPAVQVAMALRNNTTGPLVAYLARAVETNYQYDYYSSSTQANAFTFVNSSPVNNFGYGFLMSNVGTPQYGFMNSYVWAYGFPSNPCNFAGGAATGVVTQGSGIMSIAYVDTIGPKRTKTATIRYSRLN